MGLFKKNVQPGIGSPGLSSNPTTPMATSSTGSSQAGDAESDPRRSQLANLFSLERKEESRSKGAGKSPGEARRWSDLVNNEINSSSSRSASVENSPNDSRPTGTRPSSRRTSAAVLEELPQTSAELSSETNVSAYHYPDSTKGDSQANQSRWTTSPGRGSSRPSQSTFSASQNTNPVRRMSESRRMSLSSRTTSFSKLARRATLKRRSSKTDSNGENIDISNNTPVSPKNTIHRAGHESLKALAISPTTPRVEDEHERYATAYEEDPAAFLTLEEFTLGTKTGSLEQAVGSEIPQSLSDKETNAPDKKAGFRNSTQFALHEHQQNLGAVESSSSPETLKRERASRNPSSFISAIGQANVPPATSKEEHAFQNTLSVISAIGQVNVPPSPCACQGGQQSGLGDFDADDFSDVFALEAATAREFDNRLNNSPASESQFSSGDSPGGLGPAIPAKFTSTDEALDEGPARKKSLFPFKSSDSPLKSDSSGKAKPAGKRPPPLLNSGPDSSEPSSSSPSTGVFNSNGDFTTGEFRITSEGMVGKPTRATRLDSDDAPSTGFMPVTIADVTLVRSLEEFRQGPTLGMGAAGRVYLGIHVPSGKSMAIKVVNVYAEAKRNQLIKELETLSSHVSRFLVRFYGAFYDGKGAVHIALEYMDGGCLSSTVQKFGPIPEDVTRMITVDCLRALRFLHRNSVLHRDFKTANILISRRGLCAKVSDFGLARDMDSVASRVDTFVGTVAYMSPERLNGGKYTYASDIWALGISIAECLLGRYPFDKPQTFFDYLDLETKDILKGARGVSAKAADFVQLCVQPDPLDRPTAMELMQHPWIADMHREPMLFKRWMDNMDYQHGKDAATVRTMRTVNSFLGGQEGR